MYDAMAPLSGKKGGKDSDDDSDDKPRRGRGRGNRTQPTRATTTEENPEATTEYFKNVFFLLLLLAVSCSCRFLFLLSFLPLASCPLFPWPRFAPFFLPFASCCLPVAFCSCCKLLSNLAACNLFAEALPLPSAGVGRKTNTTQA